MASGGTETSRPDVGRTTARVICLYGWPDHPVWKLRTSGLGVRTTTTDEMQQGISAEIGINSANGWYPAGLDLCLRLPFGHVEPSEALWQALKPLLESGQRRRLEATARPYSRVSAQNGGSGYGVCASAPIRKRGKGFLSDFYGYNPFH